MVILTCFLPTLVIGLYWKRGTATAAISCVAIGGVTVIGWYFARRAGWVSWHEVYVGTSIAIFAYMAVSMLKVQTPIAVTIDQRK